VSKEDVCEVKRCRQLPILGYTIKGRVVRVCDKHWNDHCDDAKKFEIKREELK